MPHPQPPIAQALQRALAAHRAGEFGQAAGLYRNILSEHPGEPNALRFLGLIEFQRGHAEEAIRLISKSVRRDPRSAEVIGCSVSSICGSASPSGRSGACNRA